MNLVANSNTGIFCTEDCGEAAGEAGTSRAFKSARDALAAGFRPCRKCTPLKTGLADPERIGIMGGSYGGYLAMKPI